MITTLTSGASAPGSIQNHRKPQNRVFFRDTALYTSIHLLNSSLELKVNHFFTFKIPFIVTSLNSMYYSDVRLNMVL